MQSIWHSSSFVLESISSIHRDVMVVEYECVFNISFPFLARYGGLSEEGKGVYYDIGSGTGKPVFAAVLMHSFEKAVGIEILESLHNAALETLAFWNENVIGGGGGGGVGAVPAIPNANANANANADGEGEPHDNDNNVDGTGDDTASAVAEKATTDVDSDETNANHTSRTTTTAAADADADAALDPVREELRKRPCQTKIEFVHGDITRCVRCECACVRACVRASVRPSVRRRFFQKAKNEGKTSG